jgi:protein-disulfide isomerase
MKSLAVSMGAIFTALALLAPQPSGAQDLRGEIQSIIKDYLARHPDEVGAIAKEYFVKHPEAVGQILVQLLKHRASVAASMSGAVGTAAPPAAPAPAPDRSAAIAKYSNELFSSPHQVNLGDRHGNVTLVEFFDYNCGFCKRALPDMLSLLKDDPKLKVVLKDFPILGPGSVDAARVAIAVRMQDPGGKKYLAFHKELLGGFGPASEQKALAAAQQAGLDIARVKKDMLSDEVNRTLQQNMTLASALGITGTPGYVVGNDVIVGAVGAVALQRAIEAAQSRKMN